LRHGVDVIEKGIRHIKNLRFVYWWCWFE